MDLGNCEMLAYNKHWVMNAIHRADKMACTFMISMIIWNLRTQLYRGLLMFWDILFINCPSIINNAGSVHKCSVWTSAHRQCKSVVRRAWSPRWVHKLNTEAPPPPAGEGEGAAWMRGEAPTRWMRKRKMTTKGETDWCASCAVPCSSGTTPAEQH